MVEKSRKTQIIFHFIMIILCIFCLFPFLLLIVSSFTDEHVLIQEGYSIIPRAFSVAAYEYIFANSATIFRAYGTTIGVTVVGTVLNIALTILFAYPLSRRDLPHRNIWSFIVFFTMLFNGGLVPSYIMWTQYFHIRNTYAALIVPSLMMGAFYVIMMRTNLAQNIPEEVLEAARIDGASEWQILFKVVMPMALPIIATLMLLVGMAYWNDWMNGLYYLTQKKYYTIQVLLNNMLQDLQVLLSSSFSANVDMSSMPSTSIKMAIAVVGALPVLCIYPFFQRYFVKGITIGAVKG
ncbi:putative aldouronate transport system permease protein [Catenibacillus scindens]|uniref:Putative aldouronate transport system permease protein n=1 Tax=Catenibacillus scindens TaxID=673271 RepID=A0A7W8HCN2_9FIRM|nr:carbohydrate ABC transporter permease [Catenibacillus scindens]MBB5266046.1 putative aldouronate transport system permease protein [Catenibacillus scindens]